MASSRRRKGKEMVWRAKVTFDPAVADKEEPFPLVTDSEAESEARAVAELVDSGAESSVGGDKSNVGGDTPTDSSAGEGEDKTAVADRRAAQVAPREPAHGNPRQSALKNACHEVGNIGVFFGNWGTRGTVGGPGAQRERIRAMDLQILRSPAHVVILCEANQAVEDLLKYGPQQSTAVAASSSSLPTFTAFSMSSQPQSSQPQSRRQEVEQRPTHEHFVVRGNERDTAVLVAVKTDNSNCLVLQEYILHNDHDYLEKGKKEDCAYAHAVRPSRLQTERRPLGQDGQFCRHPSQFKNCDHEVANCVKRLLGPTVS